MKRWIAKVRPALVLLAVTSVMAVILALGNSITAQRIEENRHFRVRAAIAAVLPDAADAKALESFPNETGTVRAVYAADSGYAVEVAPAGFGAEIDMMVGVDMDGRITKISIISHAETPGLGANAAADTSAGVRFRGQFSGADTAQSIAKDGGTVAVLTSATITSRAVTDGVNDALACVQALMEEGTA